MKDCFCWLCLESFWLFTMISLSSGANLIRNVKFTVEKIKEINKPLFKINGKKIPI